MDAGRVAFEAPTVKEKIILFICVYTLFSSNLSDERAHTVRQFNDVGRREVVFDVVEPVEEPHYLLVDGAGFEIIVRCKWRGADHHLE
jgi:hypothetical protein